MAVKIQIRRGKKAGLPALAPGEYGLATDTGELFIGGATGNIQVAVLGSNGKVPAGQLPEMDYDPAGSAEKSVAAHDTDGAAHADLRIAIAGKAAVAHTHTPASIGAAPAYTYGTADLTAGSSSLATGTLYLVYE